MLRGEQKNSTMRQFGNVTIRQFDIETIGNKTIRRFKNEKMYHHETSMIWQTQNSMYKFFMRVPHR